MVVLDFTDAFCRSVVFADLGRQRRQYDASRYLDYFIRVSQSFRRDVDGHLYVLFVFWSSGHFHWLGYPVYCRDDSRHN